MPRTRCEEFLQANGLRARDLAEIAGIDVRGFRSIRKGNTKKPRQFTRECIAGAASRMLGRVVEVVEIFDEPPAR